MKRTAIFLDTTIQVDRLIKEHVPSKRSAIDKLLNVYSYSATCTFSRLEFKRVVLQNLALSLAYLIEEGSWFLALERANRLRRSRRGATLVSVMSWLGHTISQATTIAVGDDLDQILRIQTESFIRTNIIFLWARFDKSVDSVLDRTECSRAKEKPRLLSNGKIEVEIPRSLCKNQQCQNVNFLRSKLLSIQKLCREIDWMQEEGVPISDELKIARDELKKAIVDPIRLYDYGNCLRVGDVWMHLESLAAGIKDFGTTNYKESQYLCPILDLQMKVP